MKPTSPRPRRYQTRGAVRDGHVFSIESSRSPTQPQAPKAGVKKLPKGARKRAIIALEKKVSEMGAEVAWSEQRELLGSTVEPDQNSPPCPSRAAPQTAKKKRGRKSQNKPDDEDRYMDDMLLSDQEEEGEEQGKGGDRIRRENRWIPDMEHRGRPTRKPANVPYQLWMSYCLLDDYMYRNSLSVEETLTHPLMDDMYTFQSGGPQPVTPAGFRWNSRKTLVPI